MTAVLWDQTSRPTAEWRRGWRWLDAVEERAPCLVSSLAHAIIVIDRAERLGDQERPLAFPKKQLQDANQ